MARTVSQRATLARLASRERAPVAARSAITARRRFWSAAFSATPLRAATVATAAKAETAMPTSGRPATAATAAAAGPRLAAPSTMPVP
ncbi:MAG: hypothetical protein HZA90_03225 [Verrucomicrobia bacterium]|nr:hypothetical protein [Verrucomicrobiota bacterium]